MTTFAMVHGGWHGTWCWEAVTPLLREAGHDVVAIDLPNQDGAEAFARDSPGPFGADHPRVGEPDAGPTKRWPGRHQLIFPAEKQWPTGSRSQAEGGHPRWVANQPPKRFFVTSTWACVHASDVKNVLGVQTSLTDWRPARRRADRCGAATISRE